MPRAVRDRGEVGAQGPVHRSERYGEDRHEREEGQDAELHGLPPAGPEQLVHEVDAQAQGQQAEQRPGDEVAAHALSTSFARADTDHTMRPASTRKIATTARSAMTMPFRGPHRAALRHQ
ncbi:hypothetical protein GCM10027090_07410 [Sinomonas soli]